MTRILVVDDNDQNLYMLKILLEGNGYQLATAKNGNEALEVAQSNAPDLIISDILMPGMDGFALCRECKKDNQLKDIPFIFYTATYTDPKDEQFALSLGAIRFIKKPSEPDQFINVIKNVLNEYKKDKIKKSLKTLIPDEEEKIYYKKYNATLIRKLETKLLELDQMNQHLSTLFQASIEMISLKSASELVPFTMKKIIELLNCDFANYFVFDENKKELCLQTAMGYLEKDLEELRQKLVFRLGEEKGIVGLIGQTQEPLILNDVLSDSRWIKTDDSIKSALFLPLTCEKRLLGVINILSKKTGNFDKECLRDVTTLTNNMAVAIDKASLYEKTQKSENHYRAFIDGSIDAIVSFGNTGVITDWSRGAEEIFGYTKDEMLNKNIQILSPPQFEQQWAEAMKETRENGYKRAWESQRITKTDYLVDVEMSITYLDSDQSYICIYRDITDRKRAAAAEEKLTKEAIRSQILIEQSRDGIVVLDENGGVHEANLRFAEMLGYSHEEISKLYVWDWDFQLPKDQLNTMIREIDETGDHFETQHKRKDGTIFDVEISTNASVFAGQKLIFCVCRDTTERKLAIEALRESKERFSAAFKFAPIGMSVVGINGEFLQVNHAFCEIIGFSEKELLQKTFQEITHPDDLEVDIKNTQNLITGKFTSYQMEKRYFHKLGHVIWVSLSVALVHDKDRNPKYFLSQIQDITERKRTEILLNTINQAAAAMGAVQTRQEIFNAIANELKKLDISCMLFPLDETQERLFTKYLSYESSLLSAVEKLLGIKHENFSFPIDPVDLFRDVIREEKTLFKDNSKQVFQQILPKNNIQIFEKIIKLLHIQNSISAPLIAEGKVIGVFSLQSDNLTQKDVPAATAFANQLAGAWNRTNILEDLKNSLEGTIRTLAATVEVRDPYTAGHQARVADLATAIAKELQLSEFQIEGIRMSASIHDLGKIQVPAEVLSKPGKLSELEFNLIKIHPRIGYELLKDIKFPWPLPMIILQHHERMDGSGYPNGLKGDEILIEARVLSVADIVEAMSSHRPYRPALGIEKALEQISLEKGTLLDPDVVDACLKVFKGGYNLPVVEN